MPRAMPDFETLRRANVTIPSTVVFRQFAEEMVLLDINQGRYYGLNLVGGRMLEELHRHGDVALAVDHVIAEFDAPRERVEQDFAVLIDQLTERGLVELSDLKE